MRASALAVVLLALGAPPASACPGVRVPGAEKQVAACLADLTTAGTAASGNTDPADWAALNAAGTQNPTGVPGLHAGTVDVATGTGTGGSYADVPIAPSSPGPSSPRRR